MKRREFIKKAGTGVAAVGTVAATSTLPSPAIAQGKKQWTAVSAFGNEKFLQKKRIGFVSIDFADVKNLRPLSASTKNHNFFTTP